MYPAGTDPDLKVVKEAHMITDGKRKYWIPKGARVKLGAYGTQVNEK